MIFDKPAYLNLELNNVWYLDKYDVNEIRYDDNNTVPLIIKRENLSFLPYSVCENYKMILGNKKLFSDKRVSIFIRVFSDIGLISTNGGVGGQYRYELPKSGISKSDIIGTLHKIYEDLSRIYVIKNSNGYML